jgi:UDP-N-acetyl-D-glucosamine dehydrogenase
MSLPKTTKSPKIGIVGQGYVGLPLARAFVESGVKVIALESNPIIVRDVIDRKSHVEDISSNDLKAMFDSGNYTIESNPELISECDAVILCVPTPLNHTGEPDLTILENAIRNVALYLQPGSILISESTSFPGTLRNIIQPLILSQNPNGSQVHLATAPERVDPGNKSWNQKNTPRLISGLTDAAKQRAVEIYSYIADTPILVSSPEIAESAKLLENSFRLLNIAFVNEFSQSMSKLGINALEVIEAAGTKPYGFMKFSPGLGAGGHCIPVDPVYLSKTLRDQEINHPLLQQAIKFNEETFQYVVDRVKSTKQQPKRILAVGLSYKEGINDLRESPALKVFYELKKSYEVQFYDDEILTIDGLKRTENIRGFDLALILVKQSNVDFNELIQGNRVVWNCTGVKIGNSEIVEIFDGKKR